MTDAEALRRDLIEVMTSPFLPANAEAKATASARLGSLWDAIVAGTMPHGTVVVPFETTFEMDGASATEQLAYAAVLSASYARVDFCIAEDGELIADQLDIFISVEQGTMQPLTDPMASHCPISERRADAAVTDAAFEAIARGEKPVFEPRSVAASCGIVGLDVTGETDPAMLAAAVSSVQRIVDQADEPTSH